MTYIYTIGDHIDQEQLAKVIQSVNTQYCVIGRKSMDTTNLNSQVDSLLSKWITTMKTSPAYGTAPYLSTPFCTGFIQEFFEQFPTTKSHTAWQGRRSDLSGKLQSLFKIAHSASNNDTAAYIYQLRAQGKFN